MSDSGAEKEKNVIQVRVASPPESVRAKYHPIQVEWYFDITEQIALALQSPPIQEFLGKVLEKEEIPKDKVREIRVMRLPPLRAKAEVSETRLIVQQLLGTYDRRWKRVNLYPIARWPDKRVEPNKKLKGLDLRVWFLTVWRAVSVVVHEILHAKYGRQEKRVQKLTAEYVSNFVKSHRWFWQMEEWICRSRLIGANLTACFRELNADCDL
jgi:hypothetical protein